ncbi:MAG TPA: hypothetical protein VLM40_16210 [Gemmata sp.]|nr:hypothetical protein [Gemmata sp.]
MWFDPDAEIADLLALVKPYLAVLMEQQEPNARANCSEERGLGVAQSRGVSARQ